MPSCYGCVNILALDSRCHFIIKLTVGSDDQYSFILRIVAIHTGLGDSFVTRDKDGAKAAVYNVLIASSYVKIYASFRKYEKRVTDPQFIKMVSQ